MRRPGAALGAPVTIVSGPDKYEGPVYEDVEVAFAPDGKLLLVWGELKRVRAVTLLRRRNAAAGW